MKLYTFPAAPNPRKVHAVIEHLGITNIEIAIVDLTKGEQQSPEYKAWNPMSRVPTLVDGDLVLWESNAICEYLCDLQGDTSLFPRDLRVRADISRWLYWQASDWQSATGPMAFEKFVKKILLNAPPDLERVARTELLFHAAAGMLDKHLEKNTFLVRNQYTLADIAVAALMTFAGPAEFPMQPYANLRAYLARIDEIPSWQKTAPRMG